MISNSIFFGLIVLAIVNFSLSCDDACKSKRVRECCEFFVTKKECLPLCRYNTTLEELATQGMACSDQLKYWMYCAADENDNTPCCKQTDLSSVCYPFCVGKVPKICVSDRDNLSKFLDCATNADKILKCHKDNLKPVAQWRKDHVYTEETCS